MNPSVKKKTPKIKVKGARQAALLCLLDFDKRILPDESLDKHAFGLDRRDRALASTLVYGVLRQRIRLDWILRHFLKQPGKALDPVVEWILYLGLFQIIYLDRVPPSAAVNESVNLAKTYAPQWAAKLVNAVLRNAVRAENIPDPEKAQLESLQKLSVVYSHPEWMVRMYIDELGFEETEALLEANNQPAPLTLRVNTALTSVEKMIELPAGHVEKVEKCRYSPEGLMIFGPTGRVDKLPGYAEGFFSVQDEAAQIVGLLANPQPGEKVLDACAGKGGKTMHLAALSDGRVVALDPDKKRLKQALSETKRLGYNNIEFVRGDLDSSCPFEKSSFDLVVVDAPCSNLGVIRRRPDVKWLKSENDPAIMSEIQKRLIIAASELVKPGGRLVYAVCTVTRMETTDVTDSLLMNDSEFSRRPAGLYLPESARLLEDQDGMIRSWPHKHNTDGFFAAVFERRAKEPPEFAF